MRYYLHCKETENEKKLSSLSKVTRRYAAQPDLDLGFISKAQASLTGPNMLSYRRCNMKVVGRDEICFRSRPLFFRTPLEMSK